MTSYDVKALYLSSNGPFHQHSQTKLQQDPLHHKGPACPYNILSHSWSFTSKTHTSSSKVTMTRSMVLPWVPPLAPSLPTCLWKSLKSRHLTLPHTPHLWLRYVGDTFVIQEAKHSQQLLQCISSQDPHIQFTVKKPNLEGSLPFLNILVSSGSNNTVITTVCRNPMHTDQYLHCDSNHFITAKSSVFNTLVCRVKVVCTNQQALHKEM